MTRLTRRDLLASAALGAAASFPARAASATSARSRAIPLYAGAIPNALEAPDEERVRGREDPAVFLLDVSRPTLTIYLPGKPDPKRAAVVICPGGSYRGVSIENEGYALARALNEFGVAAFVLKYRTPSARTMRDRALGALQDAQQALHVVRRRASEWGVDPARIGVAGFSAGGHLAASAATRFAEPVLAEHGDVRPDFTLLLYPVISMRDELTHRVSREQLLGTQPALKEIERFSADQAVTQRTPPAFIMHAADDASVVVGNSLRFFEALNAHKVPSQLLVYPRGGHGFGLHNATTSDRWIDRARAWMHAEGWLESA